MRKRRGKVEGPFGVTDVPPPAKINYTEVPRYADELPLSNTVKIPEKLLNNLLGRSKRLTRELSNNLLLHDASLMLSLESTSTYVQAALRDGLGLEVEVDGDLPVLLSNLSKISVVYFYLRKMKTLPVGIKRYFLRKFIDQLIGQCMTEMRASQHSSSMAQKLEGIVSTTLGRKVSREKK